MIIIHQYCPTMATNIQDDTQANLITTLKQQLQIIMNRDTYQLSESELRQMGTSLLFDINNKFINQNELIKTIAVKSNTFFDNYKQMKQDYEQQITELNEEIQYKSISMDNLQEVLNHLQKKIKVHEEQYEKLKLQYNKIQDKLQSQEKEFKDQKDTLVHSLKEFDRQCINYKNTISKITNEKEILFDQIKHQRNINKEQLQQIENLRSMVQTEEKTIKANELKWNDLHRYNLKLEENLREKTEAIKRLQNEIKTYKNNCHNQNIASLDTYLENDLQFQSQFGQNNNNKKNISLEEDMPFHGKYITFDSQFNDKDLNTHKYNMQRQYNGQTMSPIRKMSLDPYLSHFILTSQSVKIKQDCEELLNIDIKPYYKQIIEKRIPMHLWDQWIRNRLRELLKKIKANSIQEDEQ